MRRPNFSRLRRQLIDLQVAPRHIRRTLLELEEHFDDLQGEALQQGLAADAASRYASSRLGNIDVLAQQIAARPELRCWPYRYPNVARVVLPVAYFALLPTVPLFLGVSRASSIARWGASLMLGAAITASMFLMLQISIASS